MKLPILFSMLTMCISAYSQKPGVMAARYRMIHVVDSTMPDKPAETEMLFQSDSAGLIFISDDYLKTEARLKDFYLRSSQSGNPGMSAGRRTQYWGAPFLFYKNYKAGTFSSISLLQGTWFAVEEPVTAINWTITPETKSIGDYPCQKATAIVDGRSYEAWFTSQIPFSHGPWKLSGLPGLIVEASDAKREIRFNLVAVSDTTVVKFDMPAMVTKTTRQELWKVIEANGQGALVPPGAARMSEAATGPASKKRGFNNPIEKQKP